MSEEQNTKNAKQDESRRVPWSRDHFGKTRGSRRVKTVFQSEKVGFIPR